MATRRINGTGSQTGQRGKLRCFSVRQDETRCSANLGNSLGLIGASGLLGLIGQPGLVAPSLAATAPATLTSRLKIPTASAVSSALSPGAKRGSPPPPPIGAKVSSKPRSKPTSSKPPSTSRCANHRPAPLNSSATPHPTCPHFRRSCAARLRLSSPIRIRPRRRSKISDYSHRGNHPQRHPSSFKLLLVCAYFTPKKLLGKNQCCDCPGFSGMPGSSST